MVLVDAISPLCVAAPSKNGSVCLDSSQKAKSVMETNKVCEKIQEKYFYKSCLC